MKLTDWNRHAPREVLWARTTAPPIMIFVYVAFRAYPMAAGRIPIAEVVITGLSIVGLTILSLTAYAELAVRPDPAPELADEVTQVLPSPIPRTPVMMLDDNDVRRIHGTLVDQGELTDELFTHEFVPIHHTPPRGFAAPGRHRRKDDDQPAQLTRDRTGSLFGSF